MKSKFHNQMKIIDYISSTEKFKLLFFIGIIIAFYGSFILGISKSNFIDASFVAFQFPIFNIIFFSLLFFNALNTCTVFEKMTFYIIRLKNKRYYVKDALINVIAVNLFYIFLFFVLFFAFMLICKGNNFKISDYGNYYVSNLFYLVFYLIRYVIFSILISTLSALIYLNFKTIVSMITNLFFLINFMSFNILTIPKSYIDFNIWKLFTIETFGNISLEITSTLLALLILESLILLLFRYTINNKNVVIS